MEMANCVRCRKLFPRIREPICEECKKKEEELFQNVKDFLDDNPSSTIMKISEATGASSKKITQWLREGRLELVSATGELKCRQCDVDISSGTYCDACLIDVTQKIDSMVGGKIKKPAPHEDLAAKKSSAAMHTRKT